MHGLPFLRGGMIGDAPQWQPVMGSISDDHASHRFSMPVILPGSEGGDFWDRQSIDATRINTATGEKLSIDADQAGRR